MENRDEQLIKDFFGKNKTEIPDDGFSTRVIRHIPEKQRNTGWIVPLFTVFGLIIAGFMIDLREIIFTIFNFISNVPLLYFVGGIMLIPLIFLGFYFYWDKKQFREYSYF